MKIKVIGAGLAGCEAAYKLASLGFEVELYEMKPIKYSPAHKSELFAELVCSNSLKAARLNSAAGLLKWEMEQLGSVCVAVAKKCSVPAGGALAVDRDLFSKAVTEAIKNHPNIEVRHQEVESIDLDEYTIVASGPLTEGALAESVKRLCSEDYLNFFDAAAPIITADSIDRDIVFTESRYGKGGDDYINCPFNKDEYEAFVDALLSAERATLHDADKPLQVYEGCMPIEVLASRGRDAMRFGPMKPVGLRDPRTGHRPWAVVQLRKENSNGTMLNLVGFQTNLKFGEQKRVFGMIPGLQNAEFVRYGVMHRNSFINSPKLLNKDFSMKRHPKIYFAGQISGVEGYMESAASGILAAYHLASKLGRVKEVDFPEITMVGALSGYICDESIKDFQPMGANFGVLPPLDVNIKDKQKRYAELFYRSANWFKDNGFTDSVPEIVLESKGAK
ncbi:MAG: methylenetetrahydrofolate--tRNA-(uracil(54)-C(5))-methyltransferase (FADH(2)-oxidizing) TrmFO [Clostridia bacterium]|nr:methylenetetrahydrofolate--tRNA-(uracil(54)-C(5))-methyltransferase (FADH(2)-oxidizing) TrmFO [Clostridia bacterium]